MGGIIPLNSAEETREFAARFASSLNNGSLLALYGPLGAGKTTFMQGLLRGLGGREEDVHSPTFVTLHHYEARIPLFHFDLYRLKSPQEFLALGFDEYFDQGGIVAIEWPERIESLLPVFTSRLRFSSSGNTRVVSYEPS